MFSLKKEITPYILIGWLIAVLGWILVLAGVAALQADCVTTAEPPFIARQVGQGSGYLGPASCSKVYGYTWFITWYCFAMLVITPVLVVNGSLSTWRAGFLGMTATLLMLLGDTSNTFLSFNDLAVTSQTRSRARTLTAGAIIASVGFYMVLICAGIVDEKEELKEKSEAPTGETHGGRLGNESNVDPTMPATYNPTYEQKS